MRTKKQISEAIGDPNFDWLGRKKFIADFSAYILSQQTSSHICINGVWGSGKTTTVTGIIEYLKKSKEKTLVLYLDVWKYEHYEHPLFALLKVMEKESPGIFQTIKDELVTKGISFRAGVNLPFISVSATSVVDGREAQVLGYAEYIDCLNELLIKAVKQYKVEKNNTFILFIDELDRAKPDFALRTIEMFHHLQDDLQTHVVYSVDMDQLNSIIKHYYGYQYNVEIFTHKVFDIIIPLGKIEKRQLIKYVRSRLTNDQWNIVKIIDLIFAYMTVEQKESLRTINKICEKINQHLEKGYFAVSDLGRNKYYSARTLALARDEDILWGYVEILIALQILALTDPLYVRNLIHGGDVNKFVDYLLSKEREKLRIYKYSQLTNFFNRVYNQDHEEKISDNRVLERDEIVKIVQNVFNPSSSWEHGNQAVFNDFEF